MPLVLTRALRFLQPKETAAAAPMGTAVVPVPRGRSSGRFSTPTACDSSAGPTSSPLTTGDRLRRQMQSTGEDRATGHWLHCAKQGEAIGGENCASFRAESCQERIQAKDNAVAVL
ncbi:hypothetical protein PVAP13_5NG580900 [Panicum virgatum]|uniref:Uncharacterized protein n=1 Tax=Panicum virgatum TaxID=38727 RepID=A0A8T0S1I1_PANVG|nr:hypothetical protein PVAP13_5NG580900 [Panicum virgatum]